MSSILLRSRGAVQPEFARIIAYAAIGFAVFGCFLQQAAAQSDGIPFVPVPYMLNSGIYTGNGHEFNEVYTEEIRIEGAPWMRLRFESFNLGQGSFLTITSLKDGGMQKLTAEHLKQWKNGTAFFNGDAVRISLHVAPLDVDVFFEIAEVISGVRDAGGARDTCDFDDRVPSTDAAVGRVVYHLASDPPNYYNICTGWIFSNGTNLTAGHCSIEPAVMAMIEFSVPQSSSGGLLIWADPDDQYFIDQTSVIFHNDGGSEVGNDWAVFACFPNPSTGLLPIEVQGEFVRGILSVVPDHVRVTGYGEDTGVRSFTQQTDAGDYLGETIEGPSDVVLEYLVDTEGGNSGGPIYHADVIHYALGIHTNGGCNPPNHGNKGTGFENDALMSAIQNFYGTSTIYVDGDHMFSLDLGPIFNPKLTVGGAVEIAPPGSLIWIVTGSYNEAVVIDKAMELVAPIGSAVIGQ